MQEISICKIEPISMEGFTVQIKITIWPRHQFFLLPKKANREGSSVENNSVSLLTSVEEKWSVFSLSSVKNIVNNQVVPYEKM